METYPILFDCRLLWRRVCWETTCRSLIHHPEKYHNITEDWEGNKYAGIDLKWDYEKEHVGQIWMNVSWTSGTNINT